MPPRSLRPLRLAVVASHPVQYYSPLYCKLAEQLEVKVFFAHVASEDEQSAAGFGVAFSWDIDLFSGFEYQVLANLAKEKGGGRFRGYDTPEIGKILRQGAFDGVLVMGWNLKCYWQAILAAKRLGLPVLVRGDSQLSTPRSILKRQVKAMTYPRLLRLFEAALYVGQNSLAYWRHYGYPEHRLFFSPHCVDNDRFRSAATADAGDELRTAHAISPNEKVALIAGKLVPFKRPLDVIHAAKLLSERNRSITVLVAGAGPLEDVLRTEAERSGVRVVLLGFCNQSEMPKAYAAADMLILPSDARETWGLVANEALASGIPVVASNACGCAKDLLEDGAAGRSYACGRIDELADAMSLCLSAPPSPASIAARICGYSLEAASSGIVRALASVCRKNGWNV